MSQQAELRKILVVDDEPQVLAAIEDTLEDQFEVLAHTSPKEAIRVLEREPKLMVVMSDQRMPGMTGDEFLGRASAVSDATRMMITGYADLEAVIRAVNEGNIFGYISKPWSPDALKMAIVKAAEHTRLLRELTEEQRLLRNLMNNFPDAIFFKDVQGRYMRINPAHCRNLGVSRLEDAVGRTVGDFYSAAEARERALEDERVFRTAQPLEDKVRRVLMSHGGLRWSSMTKAPILDEKGRVTGLVGIERDVTERQLAEEKVRRLNRVYAVLSEINALIVRVRNREALYQEACRIAVEAGGFRFAWIGIVDPTGERILPVAWGGAENGFLAVAAPRLGTGEHAPDGGSLAAQAIRTGRPIISNDVTGDPRLLFKEHHAASGTRSLAVLPLTVAEKSVGALVLHVDEPGFFDEAEVRLLTELAGDISFALEHIEKSERLDYLAYYDSLTGLANRSLFLEHVKLACDASAHDKAVLAVLVLDVERFRIVNDTLGRQAGDALLKEIAARLQGQAGDTRIARIGIDQFAALMPDVEDEDELARRAEQRIREVFAASYRLGDTELRIAAKYGIAIFPGDGRDADTLLKNAEAALKKAKGTGERYLFYTQEMTDRVGEHLRMETRLREALEREEFILHYQPKIDMETKAIVGLEALLRWNSPEGLVPPGKFIPLLEETGLILDVGAWALRRAAADYRSLGREGLAVPRIAVNVSAVQLRRRDFVDTVKSAVENSAGVAGIDLEITESLIMADTTGNIAKLKALRALGMEIAIDDFGTGYSSLAYLATLPVQALKIDRSFVITMLENPDTMTLVSTIISLAHSLRLKVIAEGVDAEEQAKMLRLLRCDQMQGYLFSKPLPLSDVRPLLRGESLAAR